MNRIIRIMSNPWTTQASIACLLLWMLIVTAVPGTPPGVP